MKKLLTFSIAFMLAVLFNTNAFAELAYQISPAYNSDVRISEFEAIRITFPEVTSIEAEGTSSTPGAFCYMTTKVNGVKSKQYDYKNGDMYIEGNVLIIPIVNAQLGEFTGYISSGAIKGNNGEKSPSIDCKINLLPDIFSLDSAEPANNATINKLEEIVLNFGSESVLTGSATVDIAGVQATFNPTETPGQVKTTLAQPIKAEGTYSFTIPEGKFQSTDGSLNEAVTLKYTVEFPTWGVAEILANPANGAKKTNLNVITLTFPEDVEIVGTSNLAMGSVAVTATKTGVREVTIAPTNPVEKIGIYELKIPANYFKGTSKKSPELNYTWEVVTASLSIEDFDIYKGYTQEVTIDLTNGIDFSGFQADLTLPAGLSVVGEFTLNRGVEGNHVLYSNVLKSSGKTRLMSYPTQKVNGKMPDLTGKSGALVTFTVQASADFADGEIKVDGIVFSTADGESYILPSVVAEVEALEYATEITFTNVPKEVFETDEVTPEDLPFTATVNAGAFEKGITWTVEPAEGVITFENGIITAVGVGQATITATALGAAPDKTVKKSCTVTVVYTHAEDIAITAEDGSEIETVAIEANDEFQLTATPTPATNKTIVWESSDTGVVTFNEATGKWKGVTVGDAVITAMIKDAEGNVYVSETIEVRVDSTPATSVVIMTTDEEPEVAPESADLHVTGTATYKAEVDADATIKAVEWESNAPKIAEVAYNAETGIATVTAKAVGKAVITVKALGAADPEGAPVVDTITINVVETDAETIVITGEFAEQYESADEGDEATTFKLTAEVVPNYTTYKNVAWVSSNPEAAAVDQYGNVTIGSGTGEVTITAIAINNEEYDAEKDYSAYVKATVSFAVVHTFATSVAIQESQESIPTLQAANSNNNTFQLTAVAAPATNKDIVWEVVVNGENEEPVVSVDQTGLVTALRTGQATVVARIEGTQITDSRVIKVGATPGDVNDNGTLDVFDINLLAAYILEADNLPENFVAAAADYNGDGAVNVADIITLSDIVLTDEETPQNARMYRTRQYADNSNSLFIEDFSIAEGETRQIAIMLNNNAAFSAFQADIYLPEGLEIVGAELSERKADHTLAYAMRNNGSVRLLSYSMGLNSYSGSEGELVYLTVKATDNFVGDFQIEIDNIKFATVDFAEYYLEPTVANVAGYTGVEGVEEDQIVVKVVGNSIVAPEGAEVYDLNGLRVNAENLAKGIYIVKVGDQIVKVII